MKEQKYTTIQHHNGSDTQQMILDLLEQMSLALTPSSLSTMQDLQENVEKMKKRLSVIEHYEQSNRDDMNKILKILGFSSPSDLSQAEINLFQNIGLMIRELQSRQEKLEQLEQQQQLQHQKEQRLQEQSMFCATQISRLEHLTASLIKRFDVLEKQETNLKNLQLQQQQQIKDLNDMMLNCIQSMSNLNKICVDLENKQMQIKSMQQQCNSNTNSIESIQQNLQQQYSSLQSSLKKLSV